MRIHREITIAPGQAFTVDRFRPEDAPGITNLFLSVYGPDYPVDLYYDPERIVEAQRRGELHPAVCRTEKGDIIACGFLYPSAPPNQDLFEVGLYMVLKEYRTTLAAFLLTKFIGDTLLPGIQIDGIFGEAVTNHTATQKVGRLMRSTDTAIELLLMSASLYEKEQSAPGRVSCVMAFRIQRDRPHRLFVPECYRAILSDQVSELGLTREITSPSSPAPASPTLLEPRFFVPAGVMRVNLSAAGADFPTRLAGVEAEADAKATVVRQWFLNLGDPAVGDAVARLRCHGYFFGGYLPRWFGDDGLLMQRVTEEPVFEDIRLYSDQAEKLLRFIRQDRQSLGGR